MKSTKIIKICTRKILQASKLKVAQPKYPNKGLVTRVQELPKQQNSKLDIVSLHKEYLYSLKSLANEEITPASIQIEHILKVSQNPLTYSHNNLTKNSSEQKLIPQNPKNHSLINKHLDDPGILLLFFLTGLILGIFGSILLRRIWKLIISKLLLFLKLFTG